MRHSPRKTFTLTWSSVTQYTLPQRYQNSFTCSIPFFHYHLLLPLPKPCTGCSEWENNEKPICVYICKNADYITQKNHTWMHRWHSNWIIGRWLYIKWYNITQVTILLHTCMYTNTQSNNTLHNKTIENYIVLWVRSELRRNSGVSFSPFSGTKLWAFFCVMSRHLIYLHFCHILL